MNNPLFGISISLICYLLFVKIQKKTNISLLNPLLFSGIFIIILLYVFNINYEDYNEGGQVITMLITPATVSLAIPLYKSLDLIKNNLKVILIATMSAVIIHAAVLITVIILLSIDKQVAISLIPKSITTAIAVDVTLSLGGLKEITVASVLITGIIGAAMSPILNKIFNIKNNQAIGLALGSSAHAVGTSKAASANETQGSFASLSLILVGLSTVIIAPVIILILNVLI